MITLNKIHRNINLKRMLGSFTKRIFKRIPLSYYPFKPFMHKHKCIFVHIPKNAGSSVLALFNDKNGRKHAKWYDFYESNDYFFKKYVKFAIVREPVSRLKSAYRYGMQGGNQSPSDLKLKEYIEAHSHDFESFVANVLSYDFVMEQPLFYPQYLFVFDRELNCKVDELLKYENLQKDWHMFSQKYSFPKELPWKNSSQKVKQLETLSDITEGKIKQIYNKDFILLNYKT
ncbi:sulfotransferase family protein [Thalassotalea sp. M1531]|uniref:Sulfotransferase family protein n=1 Tax=Thalassotalea algicola TaxID=2716224 RepID=A0A7Y0Q815_9GAMM|nr:sulfotransferase family 2 domain-containing protein [Thalassotalea algicola]NMP32958.1 sulfotransferase family protein [Thalassotalea algicola]